MMKKQEQIKEKIEKIKTEIARLEIVRPGSVSSQKRKRGSEYTQLSYSYKGKGHTEYVRPEHVRQLKKEIEDYKRLKQLISEWIGLSIKVSKLRRNQKK